MSAKTVFIVDDDEGVRTSLSILLDSVGYVPVPFASASDFLTQYDANRPGCLVLDIRMPDMGGMELQQELASRGAFLPVIFITGHGDVPMAVQAMKSLLATMTCSTGLHVHSKPMPKHGRRCRRTRKSSGATPR
jgi:FixJ family two-component response regulator